MNRNSEQHFAVAPRVQTERSVFKMGQNIKTTFNAGYLIPFYVDSDVLPGDTFKVGLSIVIRMATPIKPVMDNLYADIYFMYTPMRLNWTNSKAFFGENEQGAWAISVEKTIPQLKSSTTGFHKGTIADYMGLPISIGNLSVNAIPFRAYIKCYNDWFRDQTQIAPETEQTGDGDTTYSQTYATRGGKPLKVAKFHDYFTSCLPSAEKSQTPVTLPLGTSAPVSVYGNGKSMGISNGTNNYGIVFASEGGNNRYLSPSSAALNADLGTSATLTQSLATNKAIGITTDPTKSGIIGLADLSNATAATINALRLAFATQRILEKDARGGTRYIEIIKQHFGVTSPDARLQRSEYLGGKRIPINIDQTIQTSQTDQNVTPQGNAAAFSITADTDHMFTKSFVEHGTILGLICVRQEHSYQQGINRMWSRKRRLDFYWPALAHLGEQAVLNKEIYATGTATDDEVFGFQERWAEYRYKPNIITGEFRSTYATPLDMWHFGDKYNSLPVLSQTFIEETDTYINRTLAVQNHDQFIMDAYVDIEATREMPVYSVPGLLDHF